MQLVNPEYSLARLPLLHGKVIVDLGSGEGVYSIHASRRAGPTGRVYAVDLRPEAFADLDEFRTETSAPIHTIVGDFEQLGGTKLADGIADVLLLGGVLLAVNDLPTTLREVARLAHAGTALLVVDWSSLPGRREHRFHQMVVDPDGLSAELERVGFKTKEIFPAGPFHFGLVAHYT